MTSKRRMAHRAFYKLTGHCRRCDDKREVRRHDGAFTYETVPCKACQ